MSMNDDTLVYITPAGRFAVYAKHDEDSENPWAEDPGFEYDLRIPRYLKMTSTGFPAGMHPGGGHYKNGHPDYWWFSIYGYVHGAVLVSTVPFNCPWDSGRAGWVAVPRPKMGGEWKTRAKFLTYLKRMVNTLNHYLTGDVYGCVVKDRETGEEVDACWGFYGDDHSCSGLYGCGKDSADHHEYLWAKSLGMVAPVSLAMVRSRRNQVDNELDKYYGTPCVSGVARLTEFYEKMGWPDDHWMDLLPRARELASLYRMSHQEWFTLANIIWATQYMAVRSPELEAWVRTFNKSRNITADNVWSSGDTDAQIRAMRRSVHHD